MLIALTAAIAIYLGVYLVNMLRTPFRSVLAVEYTDVDSVEAKGYVIRNEQVLVSGSSFVEPAVSSGSKVAKGQVMARGYSESQDHSSISQIEALQEQLKRIEDTISVKTSSSDANSIESEIFDQLCRLSREKNTGSALHKDDYVGELKVLFLKKVYLYGGEEKLESAAESIKDEIAWLTDSNSLNGNQICAESSGIFSDSCDGFEKSLNTAMLEGMTVEDYDSMDSLEQRLPAGTYGKLITSNDWSFVTVLDTADAEKLKEGKRINVDLSGSFDGQIEMKISRMLTQGDRTLVVLTSNRYLYALADVRQLTAQIVLSRSSGIRIPKKAVVMQEQEDGSDPIFGVYCVDGITARFKPVTIVSQTGDYYIVEENKEDAYALRVGSEIIVTLKDMYEGKVLQ